MAELTTYKGMQILTPAPTGEGGDAIQDNFRDIADRIGTSGTPAAFDLANFGTAPDLLSITNGIISMAEGTKRHLDLHPKVNTVEINKAEVPTSVYIGLFSGYSLPIWNNNSEQLSYGQHVPGRWDGVTDVCTSFTFCLASAETIGKTCRFQLSWNRATVGSVVPLTSIDIEVEHTILDGTQYAIFELDFSIVLNSVTPSLQHEDILGMRLRRIASTGDEVDGEIIVLDCHQCFIVNKMFKA